MCLLLFVVGRITQHQLLCISCVNVVFVYRKVRWLTFSVLRPFIPFNSSSLYLIPLEKNGQWVEWVGELEKNRKGRLMYLSTDAARIVRVRRVSFFSSSSLS